MTMKTIRNKRRSLVRIIASCVPDFIWRYILPKSPRMYINADAMGKLLALKQNNFQLEDESFYSFKSHFCHKKESQNLFSTPSKEGMQENARITELQKELEEIKKQIAKLMEHQCEMLPSSAHGTVTIPQESSMQVPLPPPPPPPLPNFQLTPISTPLKSQNTKQNILPPIKNGLPSGKELLRDLKKVQLRKIEKSPGGGPLKKPKKINDPRDYLEAILRKRFGSIQNSPESSIESDTNPSLSFESFNADPNVVKSFKNTVT